MDFFELNAGRIVDLVLAIAAFITALTALIVALRGRKDNNNGKR